jgi:hypothetical protein
MTSPPSDGTARLPALPIPAAAKPQVSTTLASLGIALEAMKLAIEMADVAPVMTGEPTPAEIVRAWQASSVLVHEVFQRLYHETRDTIALIQPMLAQD